MIRKNEDRFGPRNNSGDESVPDPNSILQFVTPTEYVSLPSSGKGYPEGHPLSGKDVIEIRHMTAKQEDMLTSRSLLKSGKALDKLISSLICDPNINSAEMLLSDRNAIIISARATGYGYDYNTKVTCPNCSTVCKRTFDLREPKIYGGDEWEDNDIQEMENGNFMITLPISNFKVEVRRLVGRDEQVIFKMLQDKRKDTSLVTQQMMMYIVAVEGHSQQNVIKHFVENIPSAQSRYLREAYERLTPSIKITRDFECNECGYEQEMEVSLGTDFFWPDR
tara:strand:- start:573 stop:1409 length:837 start_codon:yes stop_codon:yes gene_type:complete